MDKKAEKIWKEQCKKEEQEKGYVKAETLFLPVLAELVDNGDITVNDYADFTVLMTNVKNKDEEE